MTRLAASSCKCNVIGLLTTRNRQYPLPTVSKYYGLKWEANRYNFGFRFRRYLAFRSLLKAFYSVFLAGESDMTYLSR